MNDKTVVIIVAVVVLFLVLNHNATVTQSSGVSTKVAHPKSLVGSGVTISEPTTTTNASGQTFLARPVR